MSKLPTNIKGRDLIRTLERLGFIQAAVHPKPIPSGTLRAILRQSKLTVKDLGKSTKIPPSRWD